MSLINVYNEVSRAYIKGQTETIVTSWWKAAQKADRFTIAIAASVVFKREGILC